MTYTANILCCYYRRLKLVITMVAASLFMQPAISSVDEDRLMTISIPMTQSKMETIIRANSQNFRGGGAHMEFEIEGVPMACISDTRHDRMRIIAPVSKLTEISDEQLRIVTDANFHLTLDARYASANGILYSAFIHPLSTLHPQDLESALKQVSQLVKNFGSSYSSGTLTFGGAGRPGKSRPAVP